MKGRTMIAFKDSKAILKATVGWEKKLKDFYDVAEIALRSQESKELIVLLREKLLENLSILQNIEADRFGGNEWIQFAPDCREEDLIPTRKIARDAPPQTILSQILEYETKLRAFYSSIVDALVTRAQKELFGSLVTFKDYQISQIENHMKSHNLGP